MMVYEVRLNVKKKQEFPCSALTSVFHWWDEVNKLIVIMFTINSLDFSIRDHRQDTSDLYVHKQNTSDNWTRFRFSKIYFSRCNVKIAEVEEKYETAFIND